MFAGFRTRRAGVSVSARASFGGRTPALSIVVERYIKNHPNRYGPQFAKPVRKAFERYAQVSGDRRISEIAPSQLWRFIRHRLASGVKTGTVRRDLHHLAAATSAYLAEARFPCVNPFHKVSIPMEGHDKIRRQPLTADELSTLMAACYHQDDEIRWLIAILIDTGARLSEVAGLSIDDIRLRHSTPHLRIQVHPWRRLKSAHSVREVPLVGIALWAARRVLESARQGQLHAFPRYNKRTRTNGVGASSTANAWLKRRGVTKQLHCFRHSLVDRLRRVGCPADLRAAICGWATGDIELRYGTGHGVAEMHSWMLKIADQSYVESQLELMHRRMGEKVLAGHTCAARILEFIARHGPATRGQMIKAAVLQDHDMQRGLRYAAEHHLLVRTDLVSTFQHTRYGLSGRPLPKPGTPRVGSPAVSRVS